MTRIPNYARDHRDQVAIEGMSREIRAKERKVEAMARVLRAEEDVLRDLKRKRGKLAGSLRDRIRDREYNATRTRASGGYDDYEYVATSDLRPFVEDWLRRYEGGGAIRVLCARTGLGAKAIYKIRNGETVHTTFKVAEALMMGLELDMDGVQVYGRDGKALGDVVRPEGLNGS